MILKYICKLQYFLSQEFHKSYVTKSLIRILFLKWFLMALYDYPRGDIKEENKVFIV